MPLPLTTAARAALEAREVAHAWLLELFTTEETLRVWDKNIDLSYESNVFAGIGDKWRVEGEIRMGVDLVPEPLTFYFDGSQQYDDTTFIGKLVDNEWHNRKVRLRGMLMDVSSEFTTPIGVHIDWNGFMDQIETTDAVDQPSGISLTCEGGTFRALDRNLVQCTDEEQRRRNTNDAFMQNVALKPSQDVPFGTSWSTIAGGNGNT